MKCYSNKWNCWSNCI